MRGDSPWLYALQFSSGWGVIRFGGGAHVSPEEADLGQDFLSSYRQVLSPTDHLLLPVMGAETADAHATASVAPSAEGILAGAPQDLPQEAVDWLNLGLWMVR